MITIEDDNVNGIYRQGIQLLDLHGVPQDSQYNATLGQTIEIPEPVSVMYNNPRERVLFNAARDINPFLHFFEPLWILAGRDDVDFLQTIVDNMKNYSDNGSTYYGAYGRRMRGAPATGDDQIEHAIGRLREDPNSRQVVINIRDRNDLWYRGKDTPCNLMVLLKVRQGKLNLHVVNRSNDFIWGLTGTNVCQFSMLQEYIADKLGVAMGFYHQTTDSFHCYNNPQWDKLRKAVDNNDMYAQLPGVRPYPMGCDHSEWDNDLAEFFFRFDTSSESRHYQSPFFCEVVEPMWDTFQAHLRWRKDKSETNQDSTRACCNMVAAEDWGLVTHQWLTRRWSK